jgi:uncharacterized membrane protein YdjX (TVP38/TMEM64 family)
MANVARPPGGVVTRSLWIRATLLFVILAFSVTALLFSPLREHVEPRQLYDTLGRIREHPAAPMLFVVGFSCLSLLGSPLIPMIVAGAAVFGFWRGAALNYVGVLWGASCSYWLARILGRDLFRNLLGSRYAVLESLIQRRGFWSMVRLRFLPVPFPVANYGSALLGVRYPLFLISTALAYVPILIVYSYFAATVVRVGDSEREVILNKLALSLVLLLLLTFLPPRIGNWRNGRWKSHHPEEHIKENDDAGR